MFVPQPHLALAAHLTRHQAHPGGGRARDQHRGVLGGRPQSETEEGKCDTYICKYDINIVIDHLPHALVPALGGVGAVPLPGAGPGPQLAARARPRHHPRAPAQQHAQTRAAGVRRGVVVVAADVNYSYIL